jgi:hypothetical protein
MRLVAGKSQLQALQHSAGGRVLFAGEVDEGFAEEGVRVGIFVEGPDKDAGAVFAGDLTLRVDAAPAGMLHEENELSRRFPGGYRALAPHLLSDRVWFVWRYVRGGAEAGMRYDGVVLLDDRWVWFPKPYLVVGEMLK